MVIKDWENEYIESYEGYAIVKHYEYGYSVAHYSSGEYTTWLESLKCIIYTCGTSMKPVHDKIEELNGLYEPFICNNAFPTIELVKQFIDWLKTLEIMASFNSNYIKG